MSQLQREGVVVAPLERLSPEQIRRIDQLSRELLEDPGLLCYNARAAHIMREAGARVEEGDEYLRVRLPSPVVDRALESAPSTVVLGARNPDNRLVLDATEPRVRFGTGSEANIWLQVDFADGKAQFSRQRGSIARLAQAAHLCEQLDNIDFFIRCLNICDPEVTERNKDVNKYAVSLIHTTKHVQAGLTSLEALHDVMRLGELIAGGKEAFRENPLLSFIACVVKSPLQMVEDTADKLMAIAERGAPLVVSSSPMGGATSPFGECGTVAQINAELLAGITLHQLVAPGAPVLYGAVPVRTRLDTLSDMYGAPEFNQYNLDCAQMARFYRLPCYSTAGVGDTEVPGIQATAEKVLTLATVPQGGAQYIHYAFGLLERTNVFCPEQAILDDAHVEMVKGMLNPPEITDEEIEKTRAMVREVMASDHRTYIYHLPLPTREPVYIRYPLEHEHGALYAAHERFEQILAQPGRIMPEAMRNRIREEIPGILPQTVETVKRSTHEIAFQK